jgi:hypothetical protein
MARRETLWRVASCLGYCEISFSHADFCKGPGGCCSIIARRSLTLAAALWLTPSLGRFFADWLSTVRLSSDEYASFWTGYPPRAFRGQDPAQWRQLLISAVQTSNRERRMVITSKGYLGLVPLLSAEGAVVYVLRGCSVPVVLHGILEHYVFAGECYVHGLMDGEAMQQVDEGMREEQDFVLY